MPSTGPSMIADMIRCGIVRGRSTKDVALFVRTRWILWYCAASVSATPNPDTICNSEVSAVVCDLLPLNKATLSRATVGKPETTLVSVSVWWKYREVVWSRSNARLVWAIHEMHSPTLLDGDSMHCRLHVWNSLRTRHIESHTWACHCPSAKDRNVRTAVEPHTKWVLVRLDEKHHEVMLINMKYVSASVSASNKTSRIASHIWVPWNSIKKMQTSKIKIVPWNANASNKPYQCDNGCLPWHLRSLPVCSLDLHPQMHVKEQWCVGISCRQS